MKEQNERKKKRQRKRKVETSPAMHRRPGTAPVRSFSQTEPRTHRQRHTLGCPFFASNFAAGSVHLTGREAFECSNLVFLKERRRQTEAAVCFLRRVASSLTSLPAGQRETLLNTFPLSSWMCAFSPCKGDSDTNRRAHRCFCRSAAAFGSSSRMKEMRSFGEIANVHQTQLRLSGGSTGAAAHLMSRRRTEAHPGLLLHPHCGGCLLGESKSCSLLSGTRYRAERNLSSAGRRPDKLVHFHLRTPSPACLRMCYTSLLDRSKATPCRLPRLHQECIRPLSIPVPSSPRLEPGV